MKAFSYWLFTLCLRILIIIEIKFFKYSAITTIGRESRDNSTRASYGYYFTRNEKNSLYKLFEISYLKLSLLCISNTYHSKGKLHREPDNIHKRMSYHPICKRQTRLFGRNQPESELSRPPRPRLFTSVYDSIEKKCFPFHLLNWLE